VIIPKELSEVISDTTAQEKNITYPTDGKLLCKALEQVVELGLVRASSKPILVKKHGYKQNSFFRYGYDLLIQKLSNNLGLAIKLISLCMSYIPMEIKCKKLITGM